MFTSRLNRLILLLLAFAGFLGAQEDIYVHLKKPGITRYNLAIKMPSQAFTGDIIWFHTLTRDIILSEAFNLVSPEGKEPEDPEKKFLFYKKAGIDFLLTSTTDLSKEGIVLRHNLYDTKTKKIVLSKQYRGTRSSLIAMAHTLADEMVLYFTGRRGVSQTRIAFVSTRTGKKEIFICDADGSNQQVLTLHKSLCLSPAFSPDGKRLAFTSYVLGKPSLYLLVWREAKLLKLPTGLALNTSPAFSPDGESLAFVGSKKGNSDVYILNLTTGHVLRLTHTRAIDTNPAYSPNGREILFTSDRTGAPQIYMMDAEGVNVRRLTMEGSYNDEATWSSDGDLIAYTSRDGNRFQIHALDVLSGAQAAITDLGSNESPSFSPDGQRIVFTSNRSGRSQVYTMNIDGSRVMQLTTEGENFSPTWSPYLDLN